MGFVASMVAGFLFFRKERIEPPPEPQSASVRALASSAQASHPIATPPVGEPEPRRLTLPSVAEEHLNPQGQQVMREVLRTFQSFGLERRQFSKGSFGEVIMDGMQRKLFEIQPPGSQ